MLKRTKIIILVSTLAGLILLAFWMRELRNKTHDLPSIMDSGRLSVLTDSSSLGFSLKGDSVFGFQYEIVKAFADTLGLELLVTQQSDLKKCLNEIENGDYDIIANLVPITSQWSQRAAFSVPFTQSRPMLIQHLSNDSTDKKIITSQMQLAGDSVYLPLNSPYKMRMENLAEEIADTIFIFEVKNMNTEQLVRLVAEKKLKYTICDEQLARILKLKYPSIDISLPIGFEQQLAWIVHPKSVLLLEKLNAFLADFIGSSAYWDIYRKYY